MDFFFSSDTIAKWLSGRSAEPSAPFACLVYRSASGFRFGYDFLQTGLTSTFFLVQYRRVYYMLFRSSIDDGVRAFLLPKPILRSHPFGISFISLCSYWCFGCRRCFFFFFYSYRLYDIYTETKIDDKCNYHCAFDTLLHCCKIMGKRFSILPAGINNCRCFFFENENLCWCTIVPFWHISATNFKSIPFLAGHGKLRYGPELEYGLSGEAVRLTAGHL